MWKLRDPLPVSHRKRSEDFVALVALQVIGALT